MTRACRRSATSSRSRQTTDTAAPSTPGGLSVTRLSASSQRLAWSPSTDNVGIGEYRVHRSTTANFTPSAANRVATVATGTTYTNTGLAAGTYYYKVVAADGAGNTSAASAQAVGDLAPPTVSVSEPAAGATLSGALTLGATAADTSGVQSVQLRVDGANVGTPDTTSPYSAVWDSRAATNGSHTVSAVATDGAGNTATSANVTVTVSNTERVAAYGFEEASGPTAVDSFNAFDGTISGATRVTTGRFGRALSFDGVNDSVAIANSSGLIPTAGMTISAWVNPSALAAWRPVVAKERAPFPTYGLYASNTSSRATARVGTTADLTTSATSVFGLNTWSHVAMTWNGTTLRLFVNGAQVASRTVTGALATGTGQVRLGGDSLRGEWFSGLIDEVRAYGQAAQRERDHGRHERTGHSVASRPARLDGCSVDRTSRSRRSGLYYIRGTSISRACRRSASAEHPLQHTGPPRGGLGFLVRPSG